MLLRLGKAAHISYRPLFSTLHTHTHTHTHTHSASQWLPTSSCISLCWFSKLLSHCKFSVYSPLFLLPLSLSLSRLLLTFWVFSTSVSCFKLKFCSRLQQQRVQIWLLKLYLYIIILVQIKVAGKLDTQRCWGQIHLWFRFVLRDVTWNNLRTYSRHVVVGFLFFISSHVRWNTRTIRRFHCWY